MRAGSCLPLLLLPFSSANSRVLLRPAVGLDRWLVGYCNGYKATRAVPSMAAAAAAADDGGVDAPGLRAYLQQAREALLRAHKSPEGDQQPQLKVVIGNEAADADSIVSAICLAYFLQHAPGQEQQVQEQQYVPVLSLPRAEMKLRPETLLLLRLAAVAEATASEQRHFVFLDEADLPALALKHPGLKLTLVDHNRLCASLQKPLERRVEAIVDHHEDKGHYPWVEGAMRDIAFEEGLLGNNGVVSQGSSLSAAVASSASLVGVPDGSLSLSRSSSSVAVGRALVASTCTLVVERFLAHAPHLLRPEVAALLLGVIMLDAAGLEPQAGKVTERDLAAVAALEEAAAEGVGEKGALYKRLSGAKFDAEWWQSLSVREALQLDYKAFTANTARAGPLRFGMSSVLLPVEDILSKDPAPVASVLRAFAAERKVWLLVLMSLVMDPSAGTMRRGLAIYAPERALGAALVERLLDPSTEGAALELSGGRIEQGGGEEVGEGEGGALWVFEQGNAQASRKQVEPVLRRLLEDPGLAFG